MSLRKLFTKWLFEWHIAKLDRMITEHQEIKKRFSELTSNMDTDDRMHIHRISRYAEMMCRLEIRLKAYGVEV